MRPTDVAIQAFRPFRMRQLESLLIVVAIALGVGVVTAMLALTLNSFEQEQKLHDSLSARELTMLSRDDDYEAFLRGMIFKPLVKVRSVNTKPASLQPEDIELARKASSSVEFAYQADKITVFAPIAGRKSSHKKSLDLLAISPEFIQAANMELVVGAWPSRREFKEQAKVIAITAWFAQSILDNPSEFSAEANSNQNPSSTKLTSKKLHRFETLIGRELVLDLGNRLKIIGVFVPPEGDQMFTNERQRILRARGIVPIGGVLVYATGTQLKFAARMGQVDSAQEQLKAYAIRKYGDAIDVLSSGNQIRVALSTSRNAASIMTFFAAGGLMIAALNITNLMLARVLGRTRGIGLSVALGSSQTLIFGLFLAEALALGLIGGLLGVVLAQGFTFGLSAALQSSKDFSYTGFDFSLRPTYFIIGIVISLCISVFFGGYPAWVASRISPSEALRV